MEWQADYISSALLMPKTAFTKVVHQEFRSVGINSGYYQRGSNISLDLWIEFLAYEMADIFQVSVAAAKIRFENLRLIRKQSQNQQLCWG